MQAKTVKGRIIRETWKRPAQHFNLSPAALMREMGKKLGEVEKSATRWEHVDNMQTRIAVKQVGRWILGVNERSHHWKHWMKTWKD